MFIYIFLCQAFLFSYTFNFLIELFYTVWFGTPFHAYNIELEFYGLRSDHRFHNKCETRNNDIDVFILL